MHWLPLVAMVIASGLLFPHSPVPRLVLATTKPGRKLDNHGNNSSNRKHSNNNNSNNDNNTSYIHSDRSSKSDNMIRSKAVVDYSSSTNYVHDSPQEDYSGTYVGGTKDTTHQSNIVEDFLLKARHNQVDYNTPSIIDQIEHKSKGVQKKERHLSKNKPQSKTMQNHNSTEDKHTADGQLATSILEDYKSQENESQNYISLDNHTPEEYKSQPDASNVADITRKGNHYPLNTTKEEIFKVADVSVRQNYNPYNGGTVKKQMPLDTATQTEHFNYLEKQMAVESDENGVDGGSERRWGLGMEVGRGKLLEEAELLFLDAHPRVLFTPSSSPPNHPPLLLLLEAGLQAEVGEREREQGVEQEDDQGERSKGTGGEREMELWARSEGGKVGGSVSTDPLTDSPARRKRGEPPHPKTRPKRANAAHDKRGERSVCEVANEWVTDKKTAIDILGNTVMVLPEIQTPRGPLKQYFFETKCRQPDARVTGGSGVSGRDCVGVDKKHWVSECKAKQSYVRALTAHPQKGVGWRWIRIDSSCVCVLQARVTRN